MNFKLYSNYQPAGDQPEAIANITEKFTKYKQDQVLVGVTGSGKTFTMASVIQNLNRPALIISHNKTLAAQLYQEFREFFPDNAVSYFVSYYDYYQPEAYIPQSDTYIEKETEINEEIDKLRLAATTNILTRPDTIVVASVSSIYNIGSPREYGHFVLELIKDTKINRSQILERLVQLQYDRNDYGYRRGTFRVRGDCIDIYPAYEDTTLRIRIDNVKILDIFKADPVSGKIIEHIDSAMLYPAKHYMTDPATYKKTFKKIRDDLDQQIKYFKSNNKLLEAQRISERVTHDLEMIQEIGYVNGIENYSRYFDEREPGSSPYTLFDYYNEAIKNRKIKDWVLFIDESHMTIPQIRGMYNGDRSRKQTLIDYGFRLPASLDNRPLRFDEFLRIKPPTLYVSATPDEWELGRSKENITEQLVRPTGLLDPIVTIRSSDNQISDLINEILIRNSQHERVLVTTLTKKTAEDLTTYLKDKGIKVQYLHSDVDTLKRTDILADLRLGTFEVIIGVNLLREGLDLPEVSLVAILDADKEGFLRSRISLVQTMGRAARNIKGEVILYASKITKSMSFAIDEVNRRRLIQEKYNKKHGITAKSIMKPIRNKLVEESPEMKNIQNIELLENINKDDLTPFDKARIIKKLQKIMRNAAKEMNFEYAVSVRDKITEIENT